MTSAMIVYVSSLLCAAYTGFMLARLFDVWEVDKKFDDSSRLVMLQRAKIKNLEDSLRKEKSKAIDFVGRISMLKADLALVRTKFAKENNEIAEVKDELRYAKGKLAESELHNKKLQRDVDKLSQTLMSLRVNEVDWSGDDIRVVFTGRNYEH